LGVGGGVGCPKIGGFWGWEHSDYGSCCEWWSLAFGCGEVIWGVALVVLAVFTCFAWDGGVCERPGCGVVFGLGDASE